MVSEGSGPLPVRWEPGEHVFIAGDTDSGKTYLANRLIQYRRHVLFIRTKLQDGTHVAGLEMADRADVMRRMDARRILLQPKLRDQRREVGRALEYVWRMGGWTVVVDELWYVEQRLKLTEAVDNLLTQGRSAHITVVTETQRPARISRWALAEAKHAFFFVLEGRDVETIKEATSPRVVEAIESLRGHRFAYYNRSSRVVATGDARRLSAIIAPPPKRSEMVDDSGRLPESGGAPKA